MFKHILLVLATIIGATGVNGQWPGVVLKPISVTGLPGLQSYVYGTHDGKWVIIGGRTDGLHRRQPSVSFADAGNNKFVYVVDPATGTSWSASLTSLPVSIQEQLSTTNMEFHQRDTILYCIGGYGYSATAGDHITHDKLTAINVPCLIEAVVSGGPIAGCFRQISDPAFAVTGGHLDRIYDVFYLVGGNKFTGRYNPMGGASYTQEYTNQVRKLMIHDDGTTLSVTQLPSYTDATNLHRRDYNLVAQIMPDGKEGLTMFSGVFQPTADLPFLSCVNIDSAGYVVNPSFSQYYNHYHCANLVGYSVTGNEMHSMFFGGIARYYDSAGVLVQDDNVPFVKTIARVVRDGAGAMTEYKLPVEMPGYLGASAELIPAPGVPRYENGVIKLDDLTSDTTLVGYVVGGINSSAANIFFVNTGTESVASTAVYEVYLVKSGTSGIDRKNEQSKDGLDLAVYPNPGDGAITVMYNLRKGGDVTIAIADVTGRELWRKSVAGMEAGVHKVRLSISDQANGGTYFLTVTSGGQKSVQKLVLESH
ncbi:MAG: T9SS type A sorting domain-containing protein [Taibaiella sp.]|nr:T9SS type A sorting domain-containing protein [Taibaiella sp.]